VSASSYQEYKETGVQWLGSIPEHWEVVPFKRLVDIRNGRDHKDVEQEEGYPVIGSGGPFAFASEYLYDGEAVLLGRKGTIDKPLYVNGRFWTVDTMYWAKICTNTCGRFAYYVAKTIPFSYYTTSTALPSITKGTLDRNPVPLPPLDEQKAIADFLDRETARIDQLIEKKRRLVELLVARHETLRDTAVSKGLDPNATYAESGVDWFGLVPMHWTVCRFNRLISSKVDYRGRTPEKVDDGIFLVTARNIRPGKIDYERSQEFTTEKDWEKLSSRGKPEIGDVLFTTEAPLGNIAQVDRTDVALAQRIMKFRANPALVSNDFLAELMMSASFQRSLSIYASGSTASGLKSERMAHLFGLVPSREEQDEIVRLLRAEGKRLDAVVEPIQRSIDRSTEFRSALITAAVTGQIDVTTWGKRGETDRRLDSIEEEMAS